MRKMMNSVLINIKHITEKLIGAWVMKGEDTRT